MRPRRGAQRSLLPGARRPADWSHEPLPWLRCKHRHSRHVAGRQRRGKRGANNVESRAREGMDIRSRGSAFYVCTYVRIMCAVMYIKFARPWSNRAGGASRKKSILRNAKCPDKYLTLFWRVYVKLAKAAVYKFTRFVENPFDAFEFDTRFNFVCVLFFSVFVLYNRSR